ncbi:MAG: sulfotransferase [Akkermansiaceae bacterium]|jgi:tetratricopeptide (TPR) repeat protein|nr:sulfotransferase [Akkermansiaceae bacterium]
MNVDSLSDDRLQQLAAAAKDSGNDVLALTLIQEACRRHPSHPGILLEKAKCLHRLRRADEAAPVIAKLRSIIAAEPALIDQLGEELQKIGAFDAATECFRQLLADSRPLVKAVAGSRLAALSLRSGQRQEAEEFLDAAESLAPHIPEVRAVRARLCREQDPASARQILSDLTQNHPSLPPPFRASCAYLLGTVCDEMDLPGDAMKALHLAKSIEATSPLVARFRHQRPAWRKWHAEANRFSADDARRWHAEASGRVSPAHAFLLGHPRSGTTLLEQMLDAHPRLVSIEESDIYSKCIDSALVQRHEMVSPAMDFGSWVRERADHELEEFRADYFRRLSGESTEASPDKLLLDKNPGLTVSIGRIARTLPCSKLMVMLRDPRDVCLSAYFQHTDPTPWSVNWLTLEECVDQYRFAMNGWLELREKLAQPFLEIRYEDLISNPVEIAQSTTHFLGLDWHSAQADPAAHAQKKFVKSPTHQQVLKPIHSRSIGRWQRYASWLSPHESKLRPLLEAFGYSDS